MSRIGNRPLAIPDGVTVTTDKAQVTVKGPLGTLVKSFDPMIQVEVKDGVLKTIRPNENKHTKQLHGTTNSIIKAMIEGVKTGFEKKLIIVGVGYRAQVQGNKINLSLGYSHPVVYDIPDGIKVVAEKPTELTVSGIDKQLVGQVAADIRAYRRPEPYKGKGVKYSDEHIIRKEGKAAGK